MTGEFPAQGASNAENVSIWWSSCYEPYESQFIQYTHVQLAVTSHQCNYDWIIETEISLHRSKYCPGGKHVVFVVDHVNNWESCEFSTLFIHINARPAEVMSIKTSPQALDVAMVILYNIDKGEETRCPSAYLNITNLDFVSFINGAYRVV